MCTTWATPIVSYCLFDMFFQWTLDSYATIWDTGAADLHVFPQSWHREYRVNRAKRKHVSLSCLQQIFSVHCLT